MALNSLLFSKPIIMKKIILSGLSIMAFGSMMAQQPSQKIEHLQKDPAQIERSAKADVRVAKDQRIFDSASVENKVTGKTLKRNAKHKKCSSKKAG